MVGSCLSMTSCGEFEQIYKYNHLIFIGYLRSWILIDYHFVTLFMKLSNIFVALKIIPITFFRGLLNTLFAFKRPNYEFWPYQRMYLALAFFFFTFFYFNNSELGINSFFFFTISAGFL